MQNGEYLMCEKSLNGPLVESNNGIAASSLGPWFVYGATVFHNAWLSSHPTSPQEAKCMQAKELYYVFKPIVL